MICFNTEEGLFNFRTAGILIRDGKVLIHRELKDNYYTLPGGRVEMFEGTDSTVVREWKEEISADIRVNRLLWVVENFYTRRGVHRHEICFYYLLDLVNTSSIPLDGIFHSAELDETGKPHLEFQWVPLNKISDIPLFPESVKNRLNRLPEQIEHYVESY